MTSKQKIAIVVAGDPGVGKSTLVYSWISNRFVPDVPPVIQRVKVPGDVTVGNHSLDVFDTSSIPTALSDMGDTTLKIQRAHVVVLVGTPERQSLERLRNVWLPKITAISENRKSKRPIRLIVAINKVDWLGTETTTSSNSNGFHHHSSTSSRGDSVRHRGGDLFAYSSNSTATPNFNWRSDSSSVLEDIKSHRLVEKYVEVSARNWNSLQRVFLMAQFAFMYPLAPVYNQQAGELTPRFQRALLRIFRMCDNDNDGVWSDHELNQFQLKCYGNVLDSAQIAQLKKTLREGNENNLKRNCVRFEGFKDLLSRCIDTNRPNIIWAAMREFGYDLELTLRRDYIRKSFPHRSKRKLFELSDFSISFLHQIFLNFDFDDDGALSNDELSKLFDVFDDKSPRFQDFISHFTQTSSHNHHDHSSVEYVCSRTDNGYIDLDGWLSVWMALTISSPEFVNECLIYLGISHNKELFHCVRTSSSSGSNSDSVHKFRSGQKVLRCLVFSPSRNDYLQLLNHLTPSNNHPLIHEEGESPFLDTIAINSLHNIAVSPSRSKHKKHISSSRNFVMFRNTSLELSAKELRTALQECDVVLVLSNETSCVDIRQLMETKLDVCHQRIPIVLIETSWRDELGHETKHRPELDVVDQVDDLPTIQCLMSQYGLSKIKQMPDARSDFNTMMSEVIRYCQNPQKSGVLPTYPHKKTHAKDWHSINRWIPIIGISFIGCVCYFCFRRKSCSRGSKDNSCRKVDVR